MQAALRGYCQRVESVKESAIGSTIMPYLFELKLFEMTMNDKGIPKNLVVVH